MLQLVLAMMLALHPDAPRTGSAHAFAVAIAYVATHDPPPDGMSRELGAAHLVEYAYEEGRWQIGTRRGDHGIAACALQVHATTEARRRELERSPIACVRAAYAVMRASVRICHSLVGYVGDCFAKPGSKVDLIATKRAEAAQGLLDAALMRLEQDARPPESTAH